jgi:YD repeat-containing protein
VYAGQNPPLSESFDLTYDGLNRVSTVTRDSDNQVVTYSYDASTGRPSSVNLSDEGTFSFSYLSNGKLESVTYPGQQGTEDYSYDSEGKLQSIEFPDSSLLSFTRTGRKDIQSAQFTDSQNTVFRYDFTYDDQANLISSNYSIDSLQMESWSYYWGPQGLEYASRSGGQAITQNFSTDPSGRILSMTYGSASYSGELYYHYDALGNTTLLTDAGGNPKASFIYDLHTGKMIDSWNPDNLVVINLEQGIKGTIGFGLPDEIKMLPPRLRVLTPEELRLLMPQYLYEDGELIPLWPQGPYPVYPREPSIWEYAPPGRSTSGGIQLTWWWHAYDWIVVSHQDTNEPPGYEFYDPNRAYMHRGGGGNFSDPTGQSTKPCVEAFSNCSKKYCGSAPLSKLYDIIRKFFQEYAFEAWVLTGGIGKAVAALIKAAKIKGAGIWGLQVAVLSFVLYWTYYSPACVTVCFMGYLHCEYTAWRKANKSRSEGWG